jgi:hypothetical protein
MNATQNLFTANQRVCRIGIKITMRKKLIFCGFLHVVVRCLDHLTLFLKKIIKGKKKIFIFVKIFCPEDVQ